MAKTLSQMCEEQVSNRDRLAAAGLNETDVEWDGSRFCLLEHYGRFDGDDYWWPTIAQVIKAWGVIAYHEIDNPPRKVSRDTSRRLMGKFADGKWRYMSFGGVNGPPCGHCDFEGFDEPTGLAAWLAHEIQIKEKTLAQARNKVTEAELDLQFYLDAMKKEKPPKKPD